MTLKDMIIEKRMVSIDEIAKGTGVCRDTIINVIKGKHKPSLLTTKKICAYFGEDWHKFVEE